MPLEFICPACQEALSAPHAAAGQIGSCKFCHARIVAPSVAGRPATLVIAPETLAGSPPGPSGPGAPPPTGDAPPGSAPGYSASNDSSPLGYASTATGTMPPPDIMANPNVAKAFMSSGTPAVADFWKRFLGFGLDMVLISAMEIGLAALMLRGRGIEVTDFWMATQSQMAGAFGFTFTLFAAKVLYGAVLEGSPLQATPGKFVLGMKVCTEQGAPLSYAGALWRNFCKWATISIVSFAPFIGIFPYAIFFYAMRDDLTQTLHDMAAGTVVAERSY